MASQNPLPIPRKHDFSSRTDLRTIGVMLKFYYYMSLLELQSKAFAYLPFPRKLWFFVAYYNCGRLLRKMQSLPWCVCSWWAAMKFESSAVLQRSIWRHGQHRRTINRTKLLVRNNKMYVVISHRQFPTRSWILLLRSGVRSSQCNAILIVRKCRLRVVLLPVGRCFVVLPQYLAYRAMCHNHSQTSSSSYLILCIFVASGTVSEKHVAASPLRLGNCVCIIQNSLKKFAVLP